MATYKDFDKLVADLKQEILDKIQGPDVMDLVGRTSRDLIYKRVKSGKGVTSESAVFPETQSLAKLSSSYIDKRKKNPPTGEFSSPARSNLTDTGQMLNSMTHRVEGKGKVILEFDDSFASDKAKWANDGDPTRNRPPRPFFNLSRGEALVVSQTITKILNGLIRLFNN